MSKLIDSLVETATGLYEAGVLSEGMLVDMKDIQLDQAQERVVELEDLVRTLAHALWYSQDCCQGDKEACNNIEEALAATPAEYVNFMD